MDIKHTLWKCQKWKNVICIEFTEVLAMEYDGVFFSWRSEWITICILFVGDAMTILSNMEKQPCQKV